MRAFKRGRIAHPARVPDIVPGGGIRPDKDRGSRNSGGSGRRRRACWSGKIRNFRQNCRGQKPDAPRRGIQKNGDARRLENFSDRQAWEILRSLPGSRQAASQRQAKHQLYGLWKIRGRLQMAAVLQRPPFADYGRRSRKFIENRPWKHQNIFRSRRKNLGRTFEKIPSVFEFC